MQINVPWLIFMVTSSLFDFEYKQCDLQLHSVGIGTSWRLRDTIFLYYLQNYLENSFN